MHCHDLSRSGYSTSKASDTNYVLWSYKIGGYLFNSPVVVDDRIYVQFAINPPEDDIYCLNATSGIKIWTSNAGTSSESSYAVVNNKVYVGSDHVYCIDADNGEFIWRYKTYGEMSASPAVVDGRVYIGSYTPLPLEAGELYCLDADTGDLIWSFGPAEEGNFYSSPAVVNGFVYVTTSRGTYCLNANTGAEIWGKGTGGEYCSPAVVNGYVYFGTGDHNFYCYNASNGDRVWSRSLGGGVKYSSPAVVDGKVYIGTRMKGYMYCFNAINGTKIWSLKTGSILSSPAVADNKVFYSASGGTFYCLNASNGVEIWKYKIGESSFCSPAIADGKVYTGSWFSENGVGKLFVFGDSDPGTPYAPEISGPTRGSKGYLYSFRFKAISPVDKDLYYWIDWGDGTNTGWIGPYDSGVQITQPHEWDADGVFTIQAKNKDIDGLVSGWGRLDMNIPRTRTSSYHCLLERFPMLERLLSFVR
jgi:outer membrane protein assembly factor BamB